MSQFTNGWNAQNGAMADTGMNPGQSMPMRNMNQNGSSGIPINTWQYSDPQQTMVQPPMNQNGMPGWKTFTPQPPSPPIRRTDGYWVDSFDDIKPKDVPMDGEMHFFPQSDNSCVYAKIWTNDGQLLAYRFLPEKVETPKQDSSIDINDILKEHGIVTEKQTERLEGLEKKLDRIYKAIMGDEDKEDAT